MSPLTSNLLSYFRFGLTYSETQSFWALLESLCIHSHAHAFSFYRKEVLSACPCCFILGTLLLSAWNSLVVPYALGQTLLFHAKVPLFSILILSSCDLDRWLCSFFFWQKWFQHPWRLLCFCLCGHPCLFGRPMVFILFC